ncbi:MAG: hypothetical protein WCF09_04485 [Gallionella sp.]
MVKSKSINVTPEMIEAAFPVYLAWEYEYVNGEETGASSEEVKTMLGRVLTVSLEVYKHHEQ